jgi:sugar O-acyltransferase (sialic acid O-acetyltransferase NeuD family)
VRDLLLVAASGLAREVAEAVRAAGRHRLVGMLDDDADRWGTVCSGVAVLGPPELASRHPDAELVVCAGAGRVRSALVARLDAMGVAHERYGRVLHPLAAVASSARLGPGTVLLAGVVLTADVAVGRHCVLMPNAVLTHDDVLGDFVTVCAGVALGGGVRVGDGAYLGAASSVRQDLAVGDWSTLGMGAVAVADVPARQVWAGNPARQLSSTSARAVSAAS